MAQHIQSFTAGAPLLSEPVPILHREEAGKSLEGGDAVYTARVMLDISPDEIIVDFAKGPPHSIVSNKELNVVVYPNPVKENLNIRFNTAITTDGSIEIYGIMGNLVYTSVINKGTSELQLNVKGINPGLYFYTIRVDNNKINSGKITIINN